MSMDSLWEILQWWALVQCANTGQLQLGWHRLLEDSKFNQPSKSARIFPGGLDLGSPGRASFPAQWLHHAVVEKTLRQPVRQIGETTKSNLANIPMGPDVLYKNGIFWDRGFWNHRTSRSSCWFRPDVPPCCVMMLLIPPHDSDQKPVSNTCFHVKPVNLRFINSWFFCPIKGGVVQLYVNQRWKDSKIDQRSSLDCFAVETALQSLHERPEICCGEFSLQPAENMVNRFCAAKKLEFVLAKIQHCASLLMRKKYQNKTLTSATKVGTR